jgi:O-antigen/teichoic acid export membrane protein
MSPKAAISVANAVIGAILGTAALVFIAQNMGPSPLGVLAYAMAFVGMLSFLSDFGVGSVHARQINMCADPAKCLGAYAVIKITLLAIFSIVTFVLIELWDHGWFAGAFSTDPAAEDALKVFLSYYILLGLCQIATHTFDAMGSVVKAQTPALLEVIVRVSFIIYVTLTFSNSPEAPAYLAAAYGMGIIAASVLVALLLSQLKFTKPDRETLITYIRSLAPVFLVSVIIIVDLYLDKVVVGYYWGEYEVGLYFGVQKMAVFVGVFSMSVATLILPSVTTYFMRNDVVASREVVNQAERYVSLIVIPTAAFYLAYGSQILSEFLGPDFGQNVRAMNLLVLSGAVLALVLPLRSAIAGADSPRTLFMVGLGGLLLQLILLLVLVPDRILGFAALGLKSSGAALALLVCSIYYFFVLRYMAWKTAKIVPDSRSFKHVFAALVMVGVMYVMQWAILGRVDWLALILLAIVGTMTYAVTAYVMGELEPSDYRYFRSMLHPQDTLKYVVNELLGKRAP